MADDFVQVAPDSTGKKIDNSSLTVGANTVYRQRVIVGDNSSTGNFLAVDANGFLGISAGTVGANTITAGTLGALSATTITSIPSITVVAMNAGTVTSSTITAALPAGTNVIGHVIVDSVTAGTIGSATVVAGTVGSATITAGTVNVNASTITAVGASTVGATAKGSQAVNFIPVQEPKDTGRTLMNFTADNISAVTAEALATVTIAKNGATSSASTYQVTSGKTLRLISFECGNVLSGTTMVQTRVRLRANTSGSAPTTASFMVDNLSVSPASAAANAVGWTDGGAMPDGIEIPGGWAIALSHISSSTAASVAISLNGFEY